MSINHQVKSRFDLTSDIGNSTENNPTADKILTRRNHRAISDEAISKNQGISGTHT